MTTSGVKALYYITHIDNLASILKRGILSHDRIIEEGITFKKVYDARIVSNRQFIYTSEGKNLWHYANLYFQPRNPMLYRVLNEKSSEDIIVILSVNPTILNRSDIFISTGNAAHSSSSIHSATEGRKLISQIRADTDITAWQEGDGSKRKIMAECLVPEKISPEMIETIYVEDHEVKKKVSERFQGITHDIVPEPDMFFHSQIKVMLTSNLFLVEGDMFFSKKQTLTISVNCQGVMGRGLASRARYQFPDVYREYQDLCKEKKLKMGEPFLYKQESSLDLVYAEEPETLRKPNGETWFLLFPTKNHWREQSDLKGIEEGLKWIQENYRREKIQSLAVPALGCGLGRLDWKDVGPLICKDLSDLEIPAWVYLPAEKPVAKEFLTREFLLGQRRLL